MAEVRKNLSLLVIFLLVLSSIEFIRIEGQPLLDLNMAYFMVVTAAIVMTLITPGIRSLNIYSHFALWGMVYIFVYLLLISPEGNKFSSAALIGFLLLEIAVWISHQLNQSLDALELVIHGLANHSYPNRTVSISKAAPQIDIELSRTRRHSRPLTLLVVQPEKFTNNPDQVAYQELRQDLLQHFANARIGQIISESARQTDIIIEDERKGIFLVLCTETERENSHTLGNRIKSNISNSLKSKVKWSTASFPEDALTMDELISVATGRLE